MNKNNKCYQQHLRHGILITIVGGMGITPVQAFEVETGSPNWAIRFDNTLKLNYAQRVESANSTFSRTWNNNDGDRNFDAGTPVSERVDVLSELDVVYKQKTGFRLSTNAWYNYAYEDVGGNNPSTNQVNNGKPDSGRLSGYADRYYNGPSAELLDAFVFTSAEMGDQSLLSFRLGKTTQYWGESVLSFAHGNSFGQSGIDIGKALMGPGTEAKELFIPRSQLSTSFTLNSQLTLAAQYFLDWNNARLPESGTYLGFNDSIQSGGHGLSTIGAANPLYGTPGPAGVNQYLRLANGHTYTPSNHGDYGLMAKWSPDWLEGTLGFYYRKTSDILPNVVLQPTAVGPAQLASGNIGNYNIVYADDIDIYGISLSKEIEGVSVGLDVNYRHNMTLLSVPGSVNPAAAAAGIPGFISSFDGDHGMARGNTVHAVLNGLAAFGATPAWDSSSLLMELAYSRWLSVTDNEQLFKGESWYRGTDKVSKDNYVLGVNFTPIWYQVFPGVDISLPSSVSVGVKGDSAVQLGGNEGTGSYSIGVGMDVRNQYRFDLKYVDNFGGHDTCKSAGSAASQGDGASPGVNGQYNCVPGQATSFAGPIAQLTDRGMVALTFKTTY